jgi:hypothetical protein
MNRRRPRFLRIGALVVLAATVAAAAGRSDAAREHERKEVAGLAIVFGAEPEPALTDEVQFLRWRVTTLSDEQPYNDFADAEVTISRGGVRFGPFALQRVRATPGQYQTRHVFTEPGEYGSVLRFRKGADTQVHTIDFTFNINDRAEVEIPRSRGGS